MNFRAPRKKYFATRATELGEVKVRVVRGSTLLFHKIGHLCAGGAVVEYLGQRHVVTRDGRYYKLDVSRLEEPTWAAEE